MLETNELQALTSYRGESPVLSVYIETDLAHNSKEALKLMLRESLKIVEGDLKPASKMIERYIEHEYDWQAPALAIFTSGDDLWETIPLPGRVPTMAYVTRKPYIRTLVDVMDRFANYGIALMDRESIRLFSVTFGRIKAETESFGETLKHHKQGGWAAARYQRHEDNLALHNLKQAIEVAEAFCTQSGCQRLLLAGHPAILAQVKELLPSDLSTRIIGEFTADSDASAHELMKLSSEVMSKVDLEEEQSLVSRAVTAATKGGQGVIGLSDALYALHQGRVRELLVQEAFEQEGFVCEHCGYVSATAYATCPFCQHQQVAETPDAVNMAIHKAIETGANVNIVRENADLATAGGIVALTRY